MGTERHQSLFKFCGSFMDTSFNWSIRSNEILELESSYLFYIALAERPGVACLKKKFRKNVDKKYLKIISNFLPEIPFGYP